MSNNTEETFVLRITLTDPIRHVDTFGGHVSYKVNTLTNNPRFSAKEIIVDRRFNDFLWLHDQLCSNFPGSIIPPLPEKQGVGRFLLESPEFVEIRRNALEVFLNRVIAKPEILYSEELKAFLEADEKEFQKTKNFSLKDNSISNVINLFQTKLSTLTVTTLSKAHMEKSESDLNLEEISNYLLQLDIQLGNISKHASLLIKRQQEELQALYDMSQSMGLLGQVEDPNLANSLNKVSATAGKLATQGHIFIDKLQVEVEVPLQDLIRYVNATKAAYQRRKDCRTIHQNAIVILESISNNLNHNHSKSSLSGLNMNKNTTEQQRAVALAKASADVTSSADILEKATKRFEKDYLFFRTWVAGEMRQILNSFVNIQVEMSSHSEKSWTEIIPYLQSSNASATSTSNSTSSQDEKQSSSMMSTVLLSTFANDKFGNDNSPQTKSNFEDNERIIHV